MRIVSLLPSATEMVSGLGLADLLVGVSHRCQWPPEVTELPAVTRSVIRDGRRVFEVDEQLLAELGPDVILTQDVCEVCAVPSQQAKEAAASALVLSRMITLQARRLPDILANIQVVGNELGVGERAARLVGRIQQRLREVAAATAGRPRPRVFAMEWLDPLKCTGGWLPDLVEAAGGEGLIAVPGAKVRTVDWQEVLAARPEVLLMMPCGWSLEQTAAKARDLTQLPGWQELPAVQTGRVYLVDGRICSKHGPRVAEAVEMLARILHPGALPDANGPESDPLWLSWAQAYGETP